MPPAVAWIAARAALDVAAVLVLLEAGTEAEVPAVLIAAAVDAAKEAGAVRDKD